MILAMNPPQLLHKPQSYRSWAEVKAEAKEVSEALGITQDRAFKLLVAMNSCTLAEV